MLAHLGTEVKPIQGRRKKRPTTIPGFDANFGAHVHTAMNASATPTQPPITEDFQRTDTFVGNALRQKRAELFDQTFVSSAYNTHAHE